LARFALKDRNKTLLGFRPFLGPKDQSGLKARQYVSKHHRASPCRQSREPYKQILDSVGFMLVTLLTGIKIGVAKKATTILRRYTDKRGRCGFLHYFSDSTQASLFSP
jgi:hypothetical protein